MLGRLQAKTRDVLYRAGLGGLVGGPVQAFHSDHYLRHTARRQEHLASLKVPVAGMRILEVGAGIGDHTHYFLDRGCTVTVTEAREENLALLRTRYPTCNVQKLNLEAPGTTLDPSFDVVYCYGLLYHLSNPGAALSFLAQHTTQIFLLETAVSFGDKAEINLIAEPRHSPTQAVSGTGCRPTRPWVYQELKSCFDFVYVPVTQPCDKEFPLDWSSQGNHAAPLQRAIFVASRHPISNDMLSPQLLMTQRRQD